MAERKMRRRAPPDWEKFRLGVGVGGLCIAVGGLIGWGVLTAPEGGTHSTGYTTTQRLARMMPDAVQEKIALVLAGLMLLFGVVLLLGGLAVLWDYLWARLSRRSTDE
ncbi:MAG: hypothetical protein HQL80_08740 [Magnetococcales bacterium]|nr:hypothetical protein [Magnetococcales bacterium]